MTITYGNYLEHPTSKIKFKPFNHHGTEIAINLQHLK
jgi:hypothetical protein